MSHPTRAPRSGIGGQTNAAGGRCDEAGFAAGACAAARMSHPTSNPASGGGIWHAAGVGSVVRPGRVRNRSKTEVDEKIKKPADGARKKAPPARKAPARGRYVDEYARPAV